MERFIDKGDETIMDNLTGLMWTKDANLGDKMTWNEFLDYTKKLTIGGYDDWRLPSAKELESLVDLERHNPSLPIDHPFINVATNLDGFRLYWSSNDYALNAGYAWIVSMNCGYMFNYDKSHRYYGWPVRNTTGG